MERVRARSRLAAFALAAIAAFAAAACQDGGGGPEHAAGAKGPVPRT
jgi:hypothetical protein